MFEIVYAYDFTSVSAKGSSQSVAYAAIYNSNAMFATIGALVGLYNIQRMGTLPNA